MQEKKQNCEIYQHKIILATGFLGSQIVIMNYVTGLHSTIVAHEKQ